MHQKSAEKDEVSRSSKLTNWVIFPGTNQTFFIQCEGQFFGEFRSQELESTLEMSFQPLKFFTLVFDFDFDISDNQSDRCI